MLNIEPEEGDKAYMFQISVNKLKHSCVKEVDAE
jgi:hypothetical protein